MNDVPNREEIPQLYRSGLSLRQVAASVGLTPGAVHSVLVRRGVRCRTGKEAFRVRYPDGRSGPRGSNWKGGRRLSHGPGIGPKANHWKGGRYVSDHGHGKRYAYVWRPDHPQATKAGYVMEHRLVAEQMLGRPLVRDEIVHHVNGDRLDNRPENLEVTRRGEHTRHHFADCQEVARLRGIVARYEAKYGPID